MKTTFHISVVYKDELYVFGGYNGLLDLHFDDLYKLDPSKSENITNVRQHLIM